MPVRHINPDSKEESGIIVSGKEADQVHSLFFGKRKEKAISKRKKKLHKNIAKSIELAKKTI